MRVDDSGYDRLPVQIDQAALGAAQLPNRCIRADGFDARAADRQGLCPWGLCVAGVNAAVNQQGIAGEGRALPSGGEQDGADAGNTT